LGGQSAAYGANSGRFTYGGGVGAAQTMQPANAYNPWATALINASTNPQMQQGVTNWANQGSPVWTPSKFQDYQNSQYGYGGNGPQGGFEF
jgi:hypothetical protein